MKEVRKPIAKALPEKKGNILAIMPLFDFHSVAHGFILNITNPKNQALVVMAYLVNLWHFSAMTVLDNQKHKPRILD